MKLGLQKKKQYKTNKNQSNMIEIINNSTITSVNNSDPQNSDMGRTLNTSIWFKLSMLNTWTHRYMSLSDIDKTIL